MNPFEQPELYDKLEFGGQRTPGVVTVRGFKRTTKWDVKAGGGIDGASTTRVGKEPASGTVTVYLVDESGSDSEQDEWQAFSILLQKSMDQAVAFDVYHPDLMTLGITSAVCTEVGQVEHDGKGGATASFSLLEYRPAKKRPASKPKSKSQASGGPTKPWVPPGPNAVAEAELQNLINQAQNAFADATDEEALLSGL